MPKFWVWHVEFDDRNSHATDRATQDQIRDVLFGEIEAQKNKRLRSAAYAITGDAGDGTTWHVVFNFNNETSTARPISAWPA